MIKLLKDEPMNANKMGERLKLDYKTDPAPPEDPPGEQRRGHQRARDATARCTSSRPTSRRTSASHGRDMGEIREKVEI